MQGPSTPTEEELREDLVRQHAELVRYGLVVWTQGNASARIPGTDEFLIKGSGIRYEALDPRSIVRCDLDGNVLDGTGVSPSSDTFAHAYVYRHMPEVGGVVHTHSTYATAFAAHGRPIPCVLTGIADEFGGEIPVGPTGRVGDDSVGHSIVETLTGHRSSAMLVARHGVFTIGRNAEAAVKTAVMTEDAARSVHAASTLGPAPEPLDPDYITALRARYEHVYGQR